MLVITQLLCLVRDGILWIGKPIRISAELIHRISQLPYKGRDLREIVVKSGDVTMIETLKRKYKLEKGQRGYVIDSISNKAVWVAT